MRRPVSVSSTEVHLRAGHGDQPASMTKLAMTRLTMPDGVRRGQTDVRLVAELSQVR